MNFNLDNQTQIIEFLEYIQYIRRYSNHTIRNYRIDLVQFIKYLYKCDPSLLVLDINKDHIKEFMFSLHAKKMSDKSIARKVATLKSLFNYMSKNNIINKNILSSITTPKVSKKLPHLLTEKEINKLFSIKLNDDRILMEMCIIELFYATGIRISELAQIQLSNVDIIDKTIKVLGKGNKERIVPFGEIAKSYFTGSNSPRV